MNISGIRPSVGFYDYNSISKTRQAEETAAVNAVAPEQTSQPSPAPVQEQEESVNSSASQSPKQTFGAYDYANQYNPDESFSMVGKEADIHSLDVEKAISDMQKDQVLHEYQYFVGADMNAGVQAAGQSATIRGAENFTL